MHMRMCAMAMIVAGILDPRRYAANRPWRMPRCVSTASDACRVLHDLNGVARYADEVIVLGKVAATGKPLEVQTAAAIRRTFQVEAHIQTLVDGSWVAVPIRPAST